MSKFRLAIGLHNHQPVGNFDAVFEQAHRTSYLPFLQLLKQHPTIRISLHQSGILWKWQEKTDADFFRLVGKLVKTGQLELMTGGFYEPILISIPEVDAHGQITMLTDYLKKHFKVDAQGLWLTERIWEPHLPKLLKNAVVSWLPIDDTHFIYAGMEHNQLTGPFVTEHEGHQVKLLPIQKRLRYLIPFGKVEQVITELKEQANRNPEGLAVYADDGEKFGVWPGTYELCYEKKWLPQLFEAFEKNSDWLEIIPLGEAVKMPSAGRAYLPSASYAEMLHWSLPPTAYVEYEHLEEMLETQNLSQRYGRFIRGGHWRGFLAKYDEANLMHKKMLAVSNRYDALITEHPELKEAAEPAREKMYSGQCNCPYWHGVFGGLYLPHIRQAIYANLIEADEILRKLANDDSLNIASEDYDADGHDEIITSGPSFSTVIKPSKGGMMINLALNKRSAEVIDTLTRRKEGYHLKLDRAIVGPTREDDTNSIHDIVIAKEEGLKGLLVEDWYLKRCFIDHFLTDDVDADRFQSSRYGEEGDFILEPYSVEKTADSNTISLVRVGHLWRLGGVIPVRIMKKYVYKENDGMISVEYDISTPEGQQVGVNFAVECNFNFQAGHAYDRYVLIDGKRPQESFLDSIGSADEVGSYTLIDEYRDIAISVAGDRPATIWRTPIWTVSLSEGGFEKVYQGTTLVHKYHLLLSDRPTRLSLTLRAGTAIEVIGKKAVLASQAD